MKKQRVHRPIFVRNLGYGLLRLVQDVFVIPGSLEFEGDKLVKVALQKTHPFAPEMQSCWQVLCKNYVDTPFFARNSAYGQSVDGPIFVRNLGKRLFQKSLPGRSNQQM